MQKQPLELFYKKAVAKTPGIFTGKYMCWSLFLIKLQIFRSVGRLILYTQTKDVIFLSVKPLKFHQLSINYVFLENIKCKGMFTKAYLEPTRTSAMKLLCKNNDL